MGGNVVLQLGRGFYAIEFKDEEPIAFEVAGAPKEVHV